MRLGLRWKLGSESDTIVNEKIGVFFEVGKGQFKDHTYITTVIFSQHSVSSERLQEQLISSTANVSRKFVGKKRTFYNDFLVIQKSLLIPMLGDKTSALLSNLTSQRDRAF